MAQFILNGVAMYAWVSITAVSFRLIFRVAGFFHFAHALAVAVGPYCLFALLAHGAPLAPALVLALVCAGGTGVGIEFFVYRVIARHMMSPLALMLASLGVYLIGQNLISLFCGDDPVLPPHALLDGSLDVFGATITRTNLLCFLLSCLTAFAAGPVLSRTRLGKSMRAMACDRRLAVESGIKTDRVLLLTYFMGSVVAALGGIMIAYDTSARPTMGLDCLLPGVVAVVLGGGNGIAGVLFASLLLAMATHLGVICVSSLWQPTIVFVVLFVYLLFRAMMNYRQGAASRALV